MRNASPSVDDFDAPASRSKRARNTNSATPIKKKQSVWFAGLRRHPGRVLVAVLGLGVTGGIVLNATVMQNARHPAPLFAPAPPATTATRGTPVPTPSARPADVVVQAAPSAVTVPVQAAPHATTPAAARAIPPTHAETAAPKRDAIAALLRSDTSQEASPRIAAAQRALQRVGFVVKPDGVINTATRQAIARFERDRGIPVTSDLSPRTMRELVAQSGVAIP